MSLHYLAPIVCVVVAVAHLVRVVLRHERPPDHWLRFIAGIAAILCPDKHGRASRALDVLKIVSRPGQPNRLSVNRVHK